MSNKEVRVSANSTRSLIEMSYEKTSFQQVICDNIFPNSTNIDFAHSPKLRIGHSAAKIGSEPAAASSVQSPT